MINFDLSWLDNAEASYVLAAYGIAFLALGGLLITSLYAARKYAAQWARVSKQRQQDINHDA